MDYKELSERLRCPQIRECPIKGKQTSCGKCQKDINKQAANAITDLLARAEVAEAKAEEWKATAMANDESELSKAHEALSQDWAKQKILVKELEARAEKAERDAKEASQEATFCRNGWKKSERERDAAKRDLEDLMLCAVSGCDMCANAITVQREPCVRLDCALKYKKCTPKWRGAKEE